MSKEKTDAIASADACTTNAGLPSYSSLLAFAQRMAYPDAGDLLILDDFRNIARNAVQPDGLRVER